jgi:hypothetical protein
VNRSPSRLSGRAAAAVALLLGAWLVSPAVVPLYDGPGQPDEPYRYVEPPAGYTSQKSPPTTASASIPVRNGVSTAAFANSSEVGPQVRVYIPPGSLQAPAGASTIQLTATPSAPKAPLPTDGTIVGNVYTITATASGGPVDVVGKAGSQTPTLQMRAPTTKQPGPTFETFDGKKWTSSETIRAGQDIYQTSAPKLGVWALVQQNGESSGFGGAQLLMLVLGIAILVIVGIIVVVRLLRARATPPARAPARAPAKRSSARR